MICNEIIIVRGGGDLASGTIHKLHRCGFRILVLEVQKPTAIRRKTSFGEAVYDGKIEIEGITSIYVNCLADIEKAWKDRHIPVVVDPNGEYIKQLEPKVVVDAIIAKKNLGTTKDMADITIALGPGFVAGEEVDVVIETSRGHDLGRLIFKGQAKENTSLPGVIGGYSIERVIYSPCDGVIENTREIGEVVTKNEIIARVGNTSIKTSIPGLLRGIIRNGTEVKKGLKIADIDPRVSEKGNCYTISDKSRNIAGGVLEAILYMKNMKNDI